MQCANIADYQWGSAFEKDTGSRHGCFNEMERCCIHTPVFYEAPPSELNSKQAKNELVGGPSLGPGTNIMICYDNY